MLSNSTVEVPHGQLGVSTTRHEEELVVVNRKNVTGRRERNFGVDGKVVLLGWFIEERELARPASSDEPELAFFIKELKHCYLLLLLR